MIRALLALLLLVAAVAGGGFFAGHPGQVEIVWQGWQIDTSVGVLAAAGLVLAAAFAALAAAAAGLRRAPRTLRRHRALRRRRAGDAALARGLAALAAGDAAEAHRHSMRAAVLLGAAPAALLLAAETADRRGDAAAARRAYTALVEQPDGEFLGLRGLVAEALREDDAAAALPLAERARQLRPSARWPAETLVALHAQSGNWVAARETLVQAARHGALPAGDVRHHRGILAYELSRAAESEGDLRRAAGLAARAQALAPDLAVPAAHHAGLLLRLGRRRAAAAAVERAWRVAPHADLARLYADLTPPDGAVARATALQKLAAHNPGAPESRLALGEAALDAGLWGEARRHLELAVSAADQAGGASKRLCAAMARLEEESTGGAAARHWLDRAIGAAPASAYACRRCGGTTSEWQSLCSQCGGFDTLAPPIREAAAAPSAAPQPARHAVAAPLMLPAPGAAIAAAANAPGLGADDAIG